MTSHSLPFRAEHIGSLLRPKELTQSFKALAKQEISWIEMNAILEQSIKAAIKLQEECGLQSITDGEFRRGSWFLGFVNAIDGLTVAPSLFQFSGAHAAWDCPYAEKKIRRARPITVDEFKFVRANTLRTPKVTMPSPTQMLFYRGVDSASRDAYPDIEEYYADLARVYREELQDLANAGCTYVQIDEVPIAMLCDPSIQDSLRRQGQDPNEMLKRYVELNNEALKDRPKSLTVGMHLCRGNYKGQWMASGGYQPIAELLFGGIDVDAFFLEYDSERAGDFTPLAHVPKNKSVVLGLVTTKTPETPPAENLKRRIDEAAKYVPLDRLAISPQCGFASSVGGNPVTIDDEKRKLTLICDVAREVWGTA
ncbi:MAG: 5-methyltetrahydropteroyltriglutamate--homocysteine S-methyltransferase [Alphaproteobacteria bacterium]